MKQDAMVKEQVVGLPKLKRAVGGTYCPGCHYGILTRAICEVLEEMNIGGKTIGLTSSSCTASAPMHIMTDFMLAPHGRAAAAASAIKKVHPDCMIFTMQGDGDLASIGLGHFMHAMLRAERVTFIFLNNAGYGQTGGQMAPTTLLGAITTTTPEGRDPRRHGYPIHVAELAAFMKGTAYSARCTIHTQANYQRTKRALKAAFQKQIDDIGLSLVEILSACPTNWGLNPVECLRYIDEKMIPEFPLGEFKNVDSID